MMGQQRVSAEILLKKHAEVTFDPRQEGRKEGRKDGREEGRKEGLTSAWSQAGSAPARAEVGRLPPSLSSARLFCQAGTGEEAKDGEKKEKKKTRGPQRRTETFTEYDGKADCLFL